MTKTRKVFYNESRKPYMTKRSYKPFLREANEFDEPVEDFEDIEQQEDDDIIYQIDNLVSKINTIRRRRGADEYDLLDAESFPVDSTGLHIAEHEACNGTLLRQIFRRDRIVKETDVGKVGCLL